MTIDQIVSDIADSLERIAIALEAIHEDAMTALEGLGYLPPKV